MLLAQQHEAEIEIDEQQQDFLADGFKGFGSDCEDLHLNTTSILMTDQVDSYDSDCDEALTASAIFIARLFPTGSANGDDASPSYDSDILSEILITYVELTNDSNVTSDIPYMDTNTNEVVKDMNSLTQNDELFLSLIENMQHEVTRCNTVNQETKKVKESLTVELERYKEKFKPFETQNTSPLVFNSKEKDLELSLKVETNLFLRNNLDALKKESTTKEDKYIDEVLVLSKEKKALENIVYKTDINNKSFEINDLKAQLQDKSIAVDELKKLLNKLNGKSKVTQCEIQPIDSMSQKLEDGNVSFKFQVLSLEKENEHLKLVYKNLYDSIKQTQAQTKLKTNSLQEKVNAKISENEKLRAQLQAKFFKQKNELEGKSMNTKFAKPSTSETKLYCVTPFLKTQFIPKVVEKNVLSKPVTLHLSTSTKVIAPEQARALRPSDENLDYACKFAQRIQELLVYACASCPFAQSGKEIWALETCHRKNDKPRVDTSGTHRIVVNNT
ncbi:hypothetical protein Tco_0558453 [Tanacetum coccineum]